MQRTYGGAKDRWRPEDKIHRPSAVKLLDLVDNSQFEGPVQDQGSMGACEGEGWAGAGTLKAKKLGVYQEQFSAKWVWNGARALEAVLAYNCGVQTGDAADWVKRYGYLLDHYWPLDPNTLDPTPPPSADFPLAAQYPVLDTIRVTGNQDSICEAIQTQDCVVIGTPWFPQWEEPGPSGVLATPQKGWALPAGNWHCTRLHGADRKRGLFLGRNSWSFLWGRGGDYSMPFEAFDRFGDYGGWDCYYIVIPAWPVEPQPPSRCWLTSLFHN